MNKPLSRVLVLTLAVLVAGIAVVPTASAQNIKPSLTLLTPKMDKNPIAADLDVATVTIDGSILYNNQAFVAPNNVIGNALVVFDPPTCDKPGVTVSGPAVFAVVVNPGTSATSQSFPLKDVKFTVTASQQAPGETDIKCNFSAKVTAQQTGAYADSDKVSTSLVMKVKFLGLISASVPTTIAEAGPQKQITYEVELTNLGNALTNVNFNLVGEAPNGWSPIPPTPIIMQSQQQGGTEFTKKINFLVQTPHKNGWNNDEKTFQLKIQPSSTKDPEQKGNEVAVNVLARVRGIYVPGPEPFLLVAALLGAALVARMVRRAE